jgi:hypothetical protein
MTDTTTTTLSTRLAIMAGQLDAFVSTTTLAAEDRVTLNDLAHALKTAGFDAAAREGDDAVHLWLLRSVLACPQAGPWLSRLPSLTDGVSLHQAIVAAVGEG